MMTLGRQTVDTQPDKEILHILELFLLLSV